MSQWSGRRPHGPTHDADCSRKWNIDTWRAHGLRTSANVYACFHADAPTAHCCSAADAWKNRERIPRSFCSAGGWSAQSSWWRQYFCRMLMIAVPPALLMWTNPTSR